MSNATTSEATGQTETSGRTEPDEPIYETCEEVAMREKRDRRQSYRKSRNRMTMVIDPDHSREANSMLLEQVTPSVATLVTPQTVEVKPTPELPPLRRARYESDEEREQMPVVEIYEMEGGSPHNCTLKEHNGFTRFVWRILSCLHDVGHVFTSSPCCVKSKKKKRYWENDNDDNNDK